MFMNIQRFKETSKSLACAVVIAGFASSASAQGFLAPFFGADGDVEWQGPKRSLPPPSPKKKEKPRAGQQISQPQAKAPAKQKVSRSAIAPIPVPLPLPRPWGNADAPMDEGGEDIASLSTEPAHPTDPDETSRSAELPSVPSAPLAQAKLDQSLVIIVRQNVRGAADLDGRSVANGAAQGDVGRMLHESAGVRVKHVDLGWAAGLERLVRGDVDGVVLGRGPKLLDSEAETLTNRDYRILEIPLAPRAE